MQYSWLTGAGLGRHFQEIGIGLTGQCQDPMLAYLLDQIWYTVTGPRFESGLTNYANTPHMLAINAIRWYPA